MEVGGPELLIVLIVIVVLFGPGRVTGLARSLGAAVHEFRDGIRGDDADDDEGTSAST